MHGLIVAFWIIFGLNIFLEIIFNIIIFSLYDDRYTSWYKWREAITTKKEMNLYWFFICSPFKVWISIYLGILCIKDSILKSYEGLE